MTKLPRILLNFLAVDYDNFVRRPALFAMAEAAQKYDLTVIAVNRPLCPFTTAITKRHRFGELFGKSRLEKLAPNLYLFSPKYWLHDHLADRVPILQRFNQHALKGAYNGLQSRLDIFEPKPLIWFNYPEQGYIIEAFPRSFCVYELYDQLADGDGRPLAKSIRLQQSQRDRVDLLLTTSRKLADNYNPGYRRAYMFGNGLSRKVYEALSDPLVKPLKSIMAIPSPRIGYAGMISPRLDLPLIASLASKRPDWNFVLVGPQKDDSVTTILSGLSNVHLIGPVEQNAVPSVLKAFDLGFLPYVDNDFSNHINPLKFYEMAAAGLRQVASATEELKSYPDEFVKVVPNSVDSWESALADFLSQDSIHAIEAGRAVAAQFIWEDMSAKLFTKLECYFSENREESTGFHNP